MTVERPKPKQLLRPITAGANSAMNQSQFLEISCNSLEAREKSRVHGAIGFGFASHWLKNWRESFKPITRRSNRNHVITFDSHLKTALTVFNVDVVALNCKLKRNLKRLISGLIIDPHNDQGPVSRKSRELFGPEKPFVKLRPAYSVKLVFSYVVKGMKIKITAKFRASRRLRFEDTKRIMSPEIRPKSFGTFEKQTPAPSWPDSSTDS